MTVKVGIVETHTDDLKSRLTVIPAQIYLSYADKHSILSIDSHLGTAATDIRTINNRNKQIGSTTLVYRRAREILEEAASIIRQPINYKFQTNNLNMINWALSDGKGMAVFDWDDWYEDDSKFFALKAIYPI